MCPGQTDELGDKTYVTISKGNSSIMLIDDNHSFPSLESWNIINAIDDPYTGIICVLEAFVLEQPHVPDYPSPEDEGFEVIAMSVGDVTGQIDLYASKPAFPNSLSVGDRIRVIGVINTFQGTPALIVHQYGKIEKISGLTWQEERDRHRYKNNDEIPVNRVQQFSGIQVHLMYVEFLHNQTQVHLSVTNDNRDAELKIPGPYANVSYDNKSFRSLRINELNIPPRTSGPSINLIRHLTLEFPAIPSKVGKVKLNFKVKKKVVHDTFDFDFEMIRPTFT